MIDIFSDEFKLQMKKIAEDAESRTNQKLGKKDEIKVLPDRNLKRDLGIYKDSILIKKDNQYINIPFKITDISEN